jgi:hypothetical protein
MPTLDLSSATELRVAGQDVQAVRIAGATVWTKPAPGPLYSADFESGVDGWAPSGSLVDAVWDATRGHTGTHALQSRRQTADSLDMTLQKTVTGLTVGGVYDYRARVLRSNSVGTSNLTIGVLGIGTSPAQSPAVGVWGEVVYRFTATATSHTLTFGATGSGSTARVIALDAVSVVVV